MKSLRAYPADGDFSASNAKTKAKQILANEN